MILRFSLAAIALYATGGVVVSCTALLSTGDRAMVLYAMGYGYMAAVCGLSAITPAMPRSGDES